MSVMIKPDALSSGGPNDPAMFLFNPEFRSTRLYFAVRSTTEVNSGTLPVFQTVYCSHISALVPVELAQHSLHITLSLHKTAENGR